MANQKELEWISSLTGANIDIAALDLTDSEDVEGACAILSISGFSDRNRFKGFLRRYTTPIYEVTAKIGNARNVEGSRAAVYLMAEETGAHSVKGGERPIRYSSEDGEHATLLVGVLFMSYDAALAFARRLRNWKFNHPLSTSFLDDPVVDEMPRRLPGRDDLWPVLLTHYDPSEADDSPCTSLRDFRGLPSAVPTEPIGLTDSLHKYQSIESDASFAARNPYKLHFKDKARFKTLREDENNMLAGSWTLHQLLDGLNTSEGHCVPLLAIKWLASENLATEFDDGERRFTVDLQIEFLTEAAEADLRDSLKVGSEKVTHLVWKTFVHVQNPAIFQECIEWKYREARRIWDELDPVQCFSRS